MLGLIARTLLSAPYGALRFVRDGADGPAAVVVIEEPLPGPIEKSRLAQWADLAARTHHPIEQFCEGKRCFGWVLGNLRDAAEFQNRTW